MNIFFSPEMYEDECNSEQAFGCTALTITKALQDQYKELFNDIKIFLIGCGHGISYILLMGYQWSGSKYGNLHSQVLSILLENGIFATLSYLFISLLIPLRAIKNDIFPIIIGLFCFNLFYQLNNEPLYWFIILYYYKYSYHKLRYAENKNF